MSSLKGKELEKFKSQFKIESIFAPTVFVSPIDNQKYAIGIGSPWIPIPDEMTRQDVHDRWVKKEFKKPETTISKVVSSSRGKGEYNVTFNGKWNCTCSGFKYKGKCSHIDKVKSELKNKLCTV